MIKIGRDNGDFISFSLVSEYSVSMPNSVTKHPVDGRTTISDHIYSENTSLRFTTSVTNDITSFNMGGVRRSKEKDTAYDYSASQIAATSNYTFDVVSEDSGGQLITTVDDVLQALREIRDNRELVTMYEVRVDRDGAELVKEFFTDMALVSLDWSESENTGDSVDIGLAFEQIKIVTVIKTSTTAKVKGSTRKPKKPKPVVAPAVKKPITDCGAQAKPKVEAGVKKPVQLETIDGYVSPDGSVSRIPTSDGKPVKLYKDERGSLLPIFKNSVKYGKNANTITAGVRG